MTSNLTMASSPEPNFGVNIQEEMNEPYVKAYRSQFDVPDDKLVEAIEYLGRLVGGVVANRDSRKLYQAVEHIDKLRRSSRSLMDGTGILKEYSYGELYNILVIDKMNNYPMEDFEKLVKEFEDRFGYLPSPSEFVDFYEEKKVKLEEKVKKLQGNQLALEHERQQERQALQQALDHERRKRQALELKIQTLELEMQRMKEREEDQLEEEVRCKLQRVVCKICLEKEVEVLFLPCNHLVSCQGCKERLPQKKCPFCRDTYQATIRVYIP